MTGRASSTQRFILPGLAFRAVLIAHGYRALAFTIIAVFVLPPVTIGIRKLLMGRRATAEEI